MRDEKMEWKKSSGWECCGALSGAGLNHRAYVYLKKSRESLKPCAFVLLLVVLFPFAGYSQSSAPVDKDAFAQHANSLYYRPAEAGLVGFTCRVNVDWNTVPSQILLPAEIAGRKPLEQTRFFVTVDASGAPSARHEYTQDAPTWMRPAYDKLFELLSSLVSGTLQTWGTKYIHGPMPEVRYVTGVEKTDDGYVVTASNPPAEFRDVLSSDYRVSEMVTKAPSGDIDEHTGFSDSPQGLLLTSNDVTNREGDDTTHIVYEMTYQMAEGFRLPSALHLKVNDNIDMKFSFESCSVQKGKIVAVRPPAADSTQHHD
jgi:hypothetical protein